MVSSFDLFRSRLGRRMFALYFLCALLPVGALAYLVQYHVFHQMRVDTHQQQRHWVKSIGMGVVDRLENIHRALTALGSSYDTRLITPYKSTDMNLLAVDGHQFRRVFLVDNAKMITPLYGPPVSSFDLTSNQEQHLRAGNPVLKLSDNMEVKRQAFMVIALNSSSKASRLLVAELNLVALVGFDFYLPSQTEYCILTASYMPLGCSDSQTDSDELIKVTAQHHNSIIPLEFRQNGITYFGYQWTIFLEGAYAATDWRVVLARPRDSLFESVDSLPHMFALMTLAALMLAILVGSTQLRKQFRPLEILREGTRALARGEFNTRVHIKSHDEFEDLSHSFNNMAYQLKVMFETNALLSELDRIILTTLDTRYVVDSVLMGVRNLMNPAALEIVLISTDRIHAGLETMGIVQRDIAGSRATQLSQHECELLKNNPLTLSLSAQDTNIRTFTEKFTSDITHATLFPVFMRNEVRVVVTAGFSTAPTFDSTVMQHCRSLIDRIAVLLANSEREKHLYQSTNFDPVTLLPNRGLLMDRLLQATARADQTHSRVAAVLIDIGHFRGVNELAGYSIGDLTLKEFGDRLLKCVPSIYTLGRFGGDEFALIVPDLLADETNTTEIVRIVEGLLESLESPFFVGGHEFILSAAVGIALFPTDTKNSEDLFAKAELAMQQARLNGKNRFHFFLADLNERSLNRLVVERELRRALANNELELYYQPKIERKSGRIIGAEALVRWRHPTLGFMSPASFLPIAAQAGLMSELDDWVLNRAVQQIRSWLSAGLAVPRIAVNISPDRFIDNLLPQRIGACLTQYGVDTHYLELEITEETIIKDIDKTMATLQAISDIGITIAVDDFGTGYSSLSYLARFPIHYLKIDRSFIVDMTLRTNVATIVSSIIALAHALGLGVVAEGVSDTSHLPLLNQFDCEVLQGFLFSQPLPPEAFFDYVVSNNYFAPNYSALGPADVTMRIVDSVT